MAAEALEAAAARAGVDIAVETQGSAGSTPLASDVIARADAAIFAVDVGRARPRPLRRQAAGRLRGQAPHGRRGLDDRRGAALRRRPGRPARRGCGGRRRRRRGQHRWRRRRRVLGGAHPSGADDRRLVHDPVRRGRRPADRPVVPARRLRDRRARSRTSVTRTRSRTCPTRPTTASTTRCSTPASSPTSARSSSSSARPRSPSSSRRWPATSPTRSPTGPASRPASSWAAWPPTSCSSGPRRPASSARIVGGVLAGVIAHWIAQRKVPTWARGLMPVLVIPLFTTHDRRRPDARGLRQADRVADGPPHRRPEQHERRQRGAPRRHPRPDDGLRHGWPAEQGRLQLRGRRGRRCGGPGRRRPRS